MVVFGRTGVDPMLEISQRSLAFEKRHLFGDEIDVRFAFRFAVAFLGIRSFADSPDRHDLDVGVVLPVRRVGSDFGGLRSERETGQQEQYDGNTSRQTQQRAAVAGVFGHHLESFFG